MFSRSAAPATVPTDTVVPLRWFDDTPLWKAFILYSMFSFDDVLDPEKLHDSLTALAKRDGWCKLGARLRRNNKGELVYHMPAEFTKDRTAIAYTHARHEMKAADHPIAARLPKPSARPATVADPDVFRPLFMPEGGPSKMDDYLNADIPQLGLHVVSFKDKTLVCLHWPHTTFDALGKRALLDAWMLMLQGRADEVVSLPEQGIDPLAELGKHPTETHKLADNRLSMFGLAGYGISNALDFIRSQENRMVCVPASFVAGLREKALAELAANGVENPFLTEGDVLCAWWTKVATSHLPRNSSRTVVLNNAYSLRKSLAGDLLPEDGTYLSNAIGFIYVLLPLKDVFEKPVSWIASEIRRGIQDLGTRAQVEAFASMWRESSGKLPPFFGERSMHMVTFSNWTKARLYDLDLSPAIITPRTGAGKPGTPSYLQNNQFGLCLPNGFPIMGKDNDGNYWFSGYMNQGQWATIDQQLAEAHAEGNNKAREGAD
ncbi:hypothetical protein F4780DRAFT_27217 [Xylariomycetidae sp. FL0641]|nr:hypothetical protein F4780DRAFT_27217 [Xylariomycetidae sp. FL0641]